MSAQPLDAPNITPLWAQLLVEELVRSGVKCFFLAPGSRSTPLVVAVARHPEAEPVVHADERGGAFAALGYGRAAGRPAAWVTTSGTAVANGLPAVVEASTDGVPMLLLTADRPPERRATGANQTIDQVKIFTDYVRWQFDLPVPTTEIAPQMVLTTADQAVKQTRRPPPGPVHLNCMFRKPLHPTEDQQNYRRYTADLEAWSEQDAPYTAYAETKPAVGAGEQDAVAGELLSVERGLVVAGRLDTARQARAVQKVAGVLGWPLVPSVTSRLRAQSGGELLPYADQLLTSEAFREETPVEAVLHMGGRTVSKRLRHFIRASQPAPYVVARPDPRRLDPDHRVTHAVETDVTSLCRALIERVEEPANRGGWLQHWRQADAAAGAVLDRFAGEAETLSEPLVARLVSEYLPENHGLVLGSSMPVRDMDRYACPTGRIVPVIANRGASGIDGTVATAAGFARGSGRPATLLIGDLALLHDLNALAMVRREPVVVVAINNDGGGIFSFLPISEREEVFEPYFATPHGRSFEKAAQMFGLSYHRPQDKETFIEAYRSAAEGGGAALIEVQTDRAENRALHERIEKRIAARVEEILLNGE